MVQVSDALKGMIKSDQPIEYEGEQIPLLMALARKATDLLADAEHLDLRGKDKPILFSLLLEHTELRVVYNGATGCVAATLVLNIDPNTPLPLPDYVFMGPLDEEPRDDLGKACEIQGWLDSCPTDLIEPRQFTLDTEDGAMTYAEAIRLAESRTYRLRRLHQAINAARTDPADPLPWYDVVGRDLESAATELAQIETD